MLAVRYGAMNGALHGKPYGILKVFPRQEPCWLAFPAYRFLVSEPFSIKRTILEAERLPTSEPAVPDAGAVFCFSVHCR